MPGTKYFCLVAHDVAVLSRASAAAEFRRHGVSTICILTVFVSMVHRRSALGAWKHAQRSYDRGYLAHPPVLFGEELLPPPPPPVFLGDELLGDDLLPPPFSACFSWCGVFGKPESY